MKAITMVQSKNHFINIVPIYLHMPSFSSGYYLGCFWVYFFRSNSNLKEEALNLREVIVPSPHMPMYKAIVFTIVVDWLC